jgi:hypothetical protein
MADRPCAYFRGLEQGTRPLKNSLRKHHFFAARTAAPTGVSFMAPPPDRMPTIPAILFGSAFPSGLFAPWRQRGDGQCNQLHSRTPGFEVPQPVGRPRAAPRGREISWPQCVLRRPCRRDWNGPHGSHRSGLVRSKLLAEKLIENFSTCLRALAERDSGLRSGDARFRLPLAEMVDLCHDVLGRQEGLARTDLRLGRGLRTDVWQQDQNDTQPEYHSQDEPHSPALFPGGSVTSSVFLPTNRASCRPCSTRARSVHGRISRHAIDCTERIVMARARSRRDARHRVRQPDIVKAQ